MDRPHVTHSPRKKRKPTYLVRKQEAEELKDQINVLQRQLEASSADEHLRLLNHSLDTKMLLQELIFKQQLVVAGVQSHFQESLPANPLYTYIRLPTSWEQRRQVIADMKENMISRACNYAIARSKHLDPLAKYSSEERFEDEQGVFCSHHFEVTHLNGAHSLKQVYDAARFFLTNVEITTSEALGFITVREDYDVDDDESTSNFRLISGQPCGIVTESNKVLYNKYFEHHELFGGRPCGIMVTDSVDEDEMYPYDPKTKARLDVSAALVMTEERIRKTRTSCESMTESGGQDDVGKVAKNVADDEELVVAIRCMSFIRVPVPEFDVPEHMLYSLGDGLSNWTKIMLKSVREYVGSS